jgi:hypothetical protein
VEKSALNPFAFGYTSAILVSFSYLVLRIIMRQLAYGSWAVVFFKSLIFSNPSQLWIITDLIQLLIISFTGGYLFATLYNRLA